MTKLILATTVGTVIAGLILYLFPKLGDLLPAVGSWISDCASWIVGTFVSSHGILGWLILTLGLLALYGVISLGVRFKDALRGTEEHEFLTYTEDMVDGVKWRWNWAGKKIVRFRAFCPVCDATLVYVREFGELLLVCERCLSDGTHAPYGERGKVVATSGLTYPEDVKDAAGREIDRRIRTGETPSAPP